MTSGSSHLSKERIQKPVTPTRELREPGSPPVARPQIVAVQLRFAQAAAMGRLGVSALRPIYEFMTAGGGACPKRVRRNLRWREETLPFIAPRLLMACNQQNRANPVRTYSDATGEGGLAGLTSSSISERPDPISLTGRAQEKQHAQAGAIS